MIVDKDSKRITKSERRPPRTNGEALMDGSDEALSRKRPGKVRSRDMSPHDLSNLERYPSVNGDTPSASSRTLIQTVNGCSELPNDPALIRFDDPPKPEAWEIVLMRLRAENKALANVGAVVKKEIAKLVDRPAAEAALLNVKEAAAYLGTSATAMRRLAWEGAIPIIRGPGKTAPHRFRKADLDRWIEQNTERL